MPPIKNIATIADKWAVVAGRSADAYQEGVESPRADWQKSTLAANGNWKTTVQAAIAQDRFKSGVEKSSSDIWRAGALNKGVSRYSAGVLLSRDAYLKGFQPYADVIARTSLPDRKPKGDPTNIQRVSVMATALHNAKLALTGAKR
jgi:hypothetical protein